VGNREGNLNFISMLASLSSLATICLPKIFLQTVIAVFR
jgi:hypothetical protein